MQRPGYFALLLLMLTSISISRAQESQIPWPLEPSDIFVEGVKYVETTQQHLYGYPLQSVEPCGQSRFLRRQTDWLENIQSEAFIVDDVANKLFIYNGNQVQSYPLPVQGLFLHCIQSNGDFVFTNWYRQDELPPLESIWIFDPKTGIFIQPTAHCGENVQALPGDWVVIQETNSSYRLCSTETGELKPPLPLLPLYGGIHSWMAIGTSPDRNYVILGASGCHGPFYSYEIASEALINLSSPEYARDYGSRCWLEHWLDDTRVLISVDTMGEWWGRFLLTADVSKPDSLGLLLSGYRFGPEYYDDPPRYEIIPGLTREGPQWWLPNCRLKIFTLENQLLRTYSLGSLCTPNLEIPETQGERLFRRVEAVDQPAQVVWVSLNTGDIIDLYQGEIEEIIGVSPGGRYLNLLIDDNGRIDVLPNLDEMFWTELAHPEVIVYDIQEQEVIHRQNVEDLPLTSDSCSPTISLKVEWVDENTFIVMGWGCDATEYLRIGWLDTGEIVVIDAITNYSISPDKTHIVFWQKSITNNPSENLQPVPVNAQVFVVNTTTGIISPITQELSTDEYAFEFDWQVDNQLVLTSFPGYGFRDRVNVYGIPIPEEETYSPVFQRYIVRLL